MTPPSSSLRDLLALVATLSGYAGRFSKDAEFRRALTEKCAACLAPAARRGGAVLSNLELCIESITAAASGTSSRPRDAAAKVRSLRNSIRLLSVVASLHATTTKEEEEEEGCKEEEEGCGRPLAACAHLYLAIVYSMEDRHDHLSARHMLQVFVESPNLARTHLLPDLWSHVFSPRLLHIELWFTDESQLMSSSRMRMKTLQRLYRDQLNSGTAQLAIYYKEWLKRGAADDDDALPQPPSVPLPTMPREKHSARNSSSINVNLYNAVFGTSFEPEDVKDVKMYGDKELASDPDVKFDGNLGRMDTLKPAHRNMGIQEKHIFIQTEDTIPEVAPTPRKSYSFRLLSCRGDVSRNVITHPKIPKKEIAFVEKELDIGELTMTLERAVSVVSSSHSLSQCEYAVHKIGRACANLRGDSNIGTWLSCPSFIQGLLEVTFTSKDDAVLDSAILIVGELVLRNEVNRQIVLNADPQLKFFLKLLTLVNNGLFLKAAVVLYWMRPKAKQMLSLDWMPLVLHILECGDEVQLLCSVKCSPVVASFYFLDQLLMGFDVDRNVENAKQMIALGGLDLLVRRLEVGDTRESKSCISILASCIRADGSCRHYLADNLKKDRVVQLLVGNQKSSASALNFISELLCLNRTTQMVLFLKELRNVGCLNTMHILLVYLQQAPLVRHPVAAVILLQLDLLGDPSQYSLYREEAIDAIIGALEHSSNSRKVQEQCSRALLLLAGRFSSSGEPIAETWLLKRAGLDDSLSGSFRRTAVFKDKGAPWSEDKEKIIEERLRKLALMLLNSGNKRFLVALSNCISDGILPTLVRACVITITWMSSSLSPLQGCNTFQPLACTILAPKLLDSLSYDRVLEERVLASLSLLNIVRHPECLEKLFPLRKETVESLRDLAEVSWTAKELLFVCSR